MTVLVMGDAGSPFVQGTYSRLSAALRDKVRFDYCSWNAPGVARGQWIADAGSRLYTLPRVPPILTRVPGLRTAYRRRRFRKAVAALPRYDIIHIQYIDPFYSDIIDLLRNRARHLFGSFWGTDFYQSRGPDRLRLKRIVQLLDHLTFANKTTCSAFRNEFGQSAGKRFDTLRFGLDSLEALRVIGRTREECKERIGVPRDRLTITCGTNGRPSQRHLAVLQSLALSRSDLPCDPVLAFPFTYLSAPLYRRTVEKQAAALHFDYRFFDAYLSTEQLACLRKATDILIQVQESDQLSGAMQEHLFAGSVVITGSWLPYDILYDQGVYMLSLSKVSDIGVILVDVIRHLEAHRRRTQMNADIVWALSSWERNIEGWKRLYLDGDSMMSPTV